MFKLKAARALCDALLKESKESTYNWQTQRAKAAVRLSRVFGQVLKTWYRDHDDLRKELHLEFQDMV